MITALSQDSSSTRSAPTLTAAAASPTQPQPAASPLPSPGRARDAFEADEAAAAAEARAAAAAEARAAAALVARGFVNRLFSTLNWTLTEFTVSVGELHHLRGQRSILEVQNQYRRTGLMFELSVNFLRLLEFVVVSAMGCDGL
jgi:hypothetical protein